MVESITGYTKGYAFVTYCDKDDAKKAADKVFLILDSKFFVSI
jgi:RNA recognition motif-containing protein